MTISNITEICGALADAIAICVVYLNGMLPAGYGLNAAEWGIISILVAVLLIGYVMAHMLDVALKEHYENRPF